MLTFSSLYRTCYYATQPRAQSKLLTSAVVLLNPIKVSHLCWSNCPILSRCISLHLHPKSVLSLSFPERTNKNSCPGALEPPTRRQTPDSQHLARRLVQLAHKELQVGRYLGKLWACAHTIYQRQGNRLLDDSGHGLSPILLTLDIQTRKYHHHWCQWRHEQSSGS